MRSRISAVLDTHAGRIEAAHLVGMNYVRFLLLSAMLVIAAVDGVAAQTGTTGNSARVESGGELYLQHYCGLCHALDRAGTAGIFGPTHDGLAATAVMRLSDANYAGQATTPEDYVRESIVEPDVFVVPGFENSVHRMPAYTHLSEEQIDAIVRFLLESPDTEQHAPAPVTEGHP